MRKLRINGETIEPTKCYSGCHLIELVNISYENGRKKGCAETTNKLREKYREGFDSGYEFGYRDASEDLVQLREVLLKILKGEHNE